MTTMRIDDALRMIFCYLISFAVGLCMLFMTVAVVSSAIGSPVFFRYSSHVVPLCMNAVGWWAVYIFAVDGNAIRMKYRKRGGMRG